MKRPSVENLLVAYTQGVFPMAQEDEDWEVYWYQPDPRTILPLDDAFHVSKTLAATVRKAPFEIRYSTVFEQVMRKCAEPRQDESGTWISEDLLQAYVELHNAGFAHSVEAFLDGELVGGLYGVTVGGLFAGESMFHRATDASKVCLVHLVEKLRKQGYLLHDTQFMTDHLRKFGAVEIPAAEYLKRVEIAVLKDCSFL